MAVRMEQYANHLGYSDIDPYEIVSRTAKTITIREMDAEMDPTWRPTYIPGGFSAICINQHDQRWIIKSNPDRPTIKAYLRKDGRYWSALGPHGLSEFPMKYYDFNF